MKEECIYCNAMVTPLAEVPMVNDDWEAIAEEHAPGCEWVTTRAHRVNPETGDYIGAEYTEDRG